jgi:hypothetical protein
MEENKFRKRNCIRKSHKKTNNFESKKKQVERIPEKYRSRTGKKTLTNIKT